MRGKKRMKVNEDKSDDEMDADVQRLFGSVNIDQSNKTKLTRVCEILSINPNILECPNDGFPADSVNDSGSQAYDCSR